MAKRRMSALPGYNVTLQSQSLANQCGGCPSRPPPRNYPLWGPASKKGFYVGLADGNAESLILTLTGLVKCRSVRQRPPSGRWSQAILATTASELQLKKLRAGEACIGIQAPLHRPRPYPGLPSKTAQRQFKDSSKTVQRQSKISQDDCNTINRDSNNQTTTNDKHQQITTPRLFDNRLSLPSIWPVT